MKKIALSIMSTLLFSSACMAQNVQLPAPQKTGGKSIIETLWSRSSGNEYSSRMLSD